MPQEYKLKNDPLDENRIKKIAKEAYDEAREDRDLALSAFTYFREVLETSRAEGDNINSTAAQKAMIDCLKLAQDSKNKALKALDLLVKFRNAKKATEDEVGNFSFNDINT
jgi:hypothetical protein